MKDLWERFRQSIGHLLGDWRTPAQSLEEAEVERGRFMEKVVRPAFEEARGILEGDSRQVAIEESSHGATFRVLRGGKEVFTYSVQLQSYHHMNFAFPQFSRSEERHRFNRVRIFKGTRTEERPLSRIDRATLRDDLLAEYDKVAGW